MDERDHASELALVAHGLLNPLHIVVGALATVRRDLGPAHPDAGLLSVAQRQAEQVADTLHLLVRGLSPRDVAATLDIREQPQDSDR